MGHNLTLELLEKQLKLDNKLLDNIDKRLSLLEDVLNLRLRLDNAKTATEQSFLKNEFLKKIYYFGDNITNLRSECSTLKKRKTELLNKYKEDMKI